MMFDYLKCEYPLPIPDLLKDDGNFCAEEAEFQTYSFAPGCLDEYEITDVGELYRWQVERFLEKDNEGEGFKLKEGKREVSKVEHTGEVVFSMMHLAAERDFFIEYKALFWKGELKEINLGDCSEEDNKKRIDAQKELSSYVCKLNEQKTRWWFPLREGLAFLINLVTYSTRWLLGWIIKLTWKIDRWMK